MPPGLIPASSIVTCSTRTSPRCSRCSSAAVLCGTFMMKSIFSAGGKSWCVCSRRGSSNHPLPLRVHLCLHPPRQLHAPQHRRGAVQTHARVWCKLSTEPRRLSEETLGCGSAERRAAAVSHLPLSIAPSPPSLLPSLPTTVWLLHTAGLSAVCSPPHRQNTHTVLLVFCLFVCLSGFHLRSHHSIGVDGGRADAASNCVRPAAVNAREPQITPHLTALQKEMNIIGSNYSRHLAFLTPWPLCVKQPL